MRAEEAESDADAAEEAEDMELDRLLVSTDVVVVS